MEIRKVFGTALLAVVMAFQTNAADIPRKEYPRPQFERAAWVNLNGEWDYTFDFRIRVWNRDSRKQPRLIKRL